MSKEKQIEEIAKILASNCGKCTECDHYHKEINEIDSCYFKYAEMVYEAGYRKQKTSEWRITGDGGYGECANCGVAPFECKYPEDLRHGWAGYCSGCGAKMLGVNNGELLTWDQLSERRAIKEALYWAVSQGVCNYCDHSPKCGKYQDDEFPINAPCMVKKRDYLEFYNSEDPNAEQR